jgi:hypothetical protein
MWQTFDLGTRAFLHYTTCSSVKKTIRSTNTSMTCQTHQKPKQKQKHIKAKHTHGPEIGQLKTSSAVLQHRAKQKRVLSTRRNDKDKEHSGNDSNQDAASCHKGGKIMTMRMMERDVSEYLVQMMDDALAPTSQSGNEDKDDGEDVSDKGGTMETRKKKINSTRVKSRNKDTTQRDVYEHLAEMMGDVLGRSTRA